MRDYFRDNTPRWRLLVLFIATLALIGAGILLLCAARDAELISPARTGLLLDRNGAFLAQVHLRDHDREAGYGYWPLETFPKRVVDATLVLEDRRFWRHPGVDVRAVFRALWQNISNRRRVSGASTIAMQLARLQHPGPRTYLRKAAEAATAIWMTLRYGRERILKHYLRLVPYGQNAHGIVYAARLFFNKPVDDLSWAEIAFLSAIPHAPGRMNPFSWSGRRQAIARGKKILQVLYDEKLIAYDEFQLSQRQIARLEIPDRYTRPKAALHFILTIENRLTDDPPPTASATGGLIHTTLDLNLQHRVKRKTVAALKQWRRKGASHAAVVITRKRTREVLAWTGSESYFSSDCGAIDFARVKRSAGSTLKPFIYAHAFERGHITPGTILDDLPANSRGFQNAEMSYMGPMLPRVALANSRNVPAVHLVETIGLDETYFFLEMLGLHTNQVPVEHYGLGLALGTLPVSLEGLVTAYGAIANDGRMEGLRWYDRQPVVSQNVLSPETARLITLFLSDPIARQPTFPRMSTTEYPFPVAVKTGTSKGYRDAWCIAYSRDYLIGVWVGRADSKPMHELGGAGSAAFLAQRIMLDLHQDDAAGFKIQAFKPPDKWRKVAVCAFTGKRAGAECGRKCLEWFPPNQIPEVDDAHKRIAIDSRNGLRATAWTPKKMRELKPFIQLSPRYAAWAAARHLPTPPNDYSPLDLPSNAMLPLKAGTPSDFTQMTVNVAIQSPRNGMHILQRPEVPEYLKTLPLHVTIHPAVPQVVWYVDNRPFKLVEAPYSARWPLSPGRHVFQVKLPYRNAMSDRVEIVVAD